LDRFDGFLGWRLSFKRSGRGVYSVKYGPAGAEFSVDPYFTHVFHAMFAGFGSLGAIFYSKKAKNGVLRVNFGAVAAGTPIGEPYVEAWRPGFV
jgi:hypothetical protein